MFHPRGLGLVLPAQTRRYSRHSPASSTRRQNQKNLSSICFHGAPIGDPRVRRTFRFLVSDLRLPQPASPTIGTGPKVPKTL
jgi:hypothetical protein